MTIPRVYNAIAAVTAEFARNGVPKRQINTGEQYAYRSIDDVTARLGPMLASHRLCILPRVLERTSCERQASNDALLMSVSLKVAFDIVSAEDGSCHTIETFAEALDDGDKATAKAMSSAFKQAVLQAFCIPVMGTEDSDSTTHHLKASNDTRDPDQGWEQWGRDIEDMLRLCQSQEAIDRVQSTYRDLLRAASKRYPEGYAAIGKTILERRQALTETPKPKPATAEPKSIKSRSCKPAPAINAAQPDPEVAVHA